LFVRVNIFAVVCLFDQMIFVDYGTLCLLCLLLCVLRRLFVVWGWIFIYILLLILFLFVIIIAIQ